LDFLHESEEIADFRLPITKIRKSKFDGQCFASFDFRISSFVFQSTGNRQSKIVNA